METTRIDRWLWAVRLYKTRSSATEACRGGHVKVNGSGAKPATPIRVGDRVLLRANGGERDVEVAEVIDKRVGAPLAAGCLVDHTPPAPPTEVGVSNFERLPSSGRPTKRDRRRLDSLRRGSRF